MLTRSNLVHQEYDYYPHQNNRDKSKKVSHCSLLVSHIYNIEWTFTHYVPYGLLRAGATLVLMSKPTVKTAYHELTAELKSVIEREDLVEHWNSLTDIQRNEWVCWTTMAKQESTNERRLKRAAQEMHEGEKTPCCWPGCPHRRPNAMKWFKLKPKD